MTALVDGAAGPGLRATRPYGHGAAVVGDGEAWVLAEEQPGRALGPALAWARQQGGLRLHLVVDDEDAAGVLARRAGELAQPPGVWLARGARLEKAVPAPVPPSPPVAREVAALAGVLVAAGCLPVVEHGRLIGEVEGLEVARVEPVEGGARLEVGVGRFDREAHALAEGDPVTALPGVVDLVRRHRRAGAPPHPLNRLAPERRLRARLLDRPGLVGAAHLAPLAAPVPAPHLRAPDPAAATGEDAAGEPLVVVCSAGVDLDLVPAAADARLADGRGARLVIAVPERDVHPVTVALAALLARPAEVVGVPPADPDAGAPGP